jgi:S-adenosylmethionine:tRNA ribosyltransferase-isomerase
MSSSVDPRTIAIRDFHYELPQERIAKYPLEERDASKLLIWQNGNIQEEQYKNVAAFVPEHAQLVFNDSRVIRARLFFKNVNGKKIEVFCLDPSEPADMAQSMSAVGKVVWKTLVGGASKTMDPHLKSWDDALPFNACILERKSDHFLVEFTWTQNLSFAELLDRTGALPIPPYLKRDTENIDAERYQTVYAKEEGSVAAPTAGLHFTKRIFKALEEKKVESLFLTLHVGAGTFKPVKADTMAFHDMHAETLMVRKNTLLQLLKSINEFRAVVGTTSMRTLESLYWLGEKVLRHPDLEASDLLVDQWQAYDFPAHGLSPERALQALVDWMNRKDLHEFQTRTSIIIAPGYQFRLSHALFTNFHQPGSTLILLVAAILGEKWKEVYDYAMEHDFRFLSYGDGSLLFIPESCQFRALSEEPQ